MLDKLPGGGCVSGVSSLFTNENSHCRFKKDATNDPSVNKLDKLFDFLLELTKDLKGNSSENGCGGKDKDRSSLQNCVIPDTTGRGGAYLNPSKANDLSEVAKYMDEMNEKFPGTFSPPHNSGGSEGSSWKNELAGIEKKDGDNYINAAELKEFEKAAVMMNRANEADIGNASGPSKTEGEGKTSGGGLTQLLEKLVNMLEKAIGKADGAEGAGESKSGKIMSGIMEMLEKLLQEMKQENAINSFIDKIKDVVKNGGAGGAEGADGKKPVDSSEGAGSGNQMIEILKMLLELIGQMQGGGAQGQKGTAGSGLNDQALSPQKMDNALVQTGQGDAYANPSEKNTLDKIGAFMDKNVEAFGKPEKGGSWVDAMQGGKNISEGDNGDIQNAMKVMQLLMELLKMLEGGSKDGGGFDQGGANAPGGVPGSKQPESSGLDGIDGARKRTSNTPETTATGGSGKTIDAGESPKGMPQDKWELCVDAGKETGVDPYILAAQMERESQFGEALKRPGASVGDGLMQVEPSTLSGYTGQFAEKFGKEYDHSSEADQVKMGALIVSEKEGDMTSKLQKYNGGDNWTPGAQDSYQRTTDPIAYAKEVEERADQMRAGQ